MKKGKKAVVIFIAILATIAVVGATFLPFLGFFIPAAGA